MSRIIRWMGCGFALSMLLVPGVAGADCCICTCPTDIGVCFSQLQCPQCFFFGCGGYFGSVGATCGVGPIFDACTSIDPPLPPTKTPTETPTNTPTVTDTPTNTPTATPTNTPVPQGGACTTPSQCSTGFCVDDVCCNSACTSGRCDLPGQRGTCSGLAPAPALAPRALAVVAALLVGVGAFTLRRRAVRL